MNNKRPQYTKSKFKMFSSCFIFYDNTGTLSFRLWFPNMPLLVLWLNIDFSIQAEAALNLGSCPHPLCKTDPRVWSWTAVAGLAPCPRAAWRAGEGSTSSSANSHSSEGTVRAVLGGRDDMHTLHTSWSKAQDSQAKEYKKRLCNILINLPWSCTNTTASAGLQRPGQGFSTIQAPVTTQIPCTLLVQQPSNWPQLKNPFSLFKTTSML